MDKMSFGTNNLSWLRFNHLGQSFVIRLTLKRISETIILAEVELFYEYEENDIHAEESIKSNRIKSIKYRIDEMNKDLTGNVSSAIHRLIDIVERDYMITFSQTLKIFGFKYFGEESYANFIKNEASDKEEKREA